MTSVTDRHLDTQVYPEPNGSGGARTDGSETPGGTPPAPPPAPILGVNVASLQPHHKNPQRARRDEWKQHKREVREERIQKLGTRLRTIDRTYYIGLGVLGCGFLAYLGAHSLLGMQRDTALALADRNQPPATATAATPEPVVVQGIPNPLADLKLTGQARWIIGEVNGELPPTRSATVLAALVDQIDLCEVFIGLNDRAAVVVQFEPTPGFTPLIECGPPAVVTVPQDLAPPTTLAPAASS